jgi:hypothetical protein
MSGETFPKKSQKRLCDDKKTVLSLQPRGFPLKQFFNDFFLFLLASSKSVIFSLL